MKISDFISSLGRYVTYQPALVPVCGSVTATIFLCNLYAWKGSEKDPNGWIYKSQKDMAEETGLTRREQDTARRLLKERNLLEEKLRGAPPIVHYRLNEDALQAAWDANQSGEMSQIDLAESAKSSSAKAPNRFGGKRQNLLLNNNNPNNNDNSNSSGAPAATAPIPILSAFTGQSRTDIHREKNLATLWRDKTGQRCNPTQAAQLTSHANAYASMGMYDTFLEILNDGALRGWRTGGLLSVLGERLTMKPVPRAASPKKTMGDRPELHDRARFEAIARQYGMKVM